MQHWGNRLYNFILNNFFSIINFIFGIGLICIFIKTLDLSKLEEVKPIQYLFLLLGTSVILLPSISKFKIGSLIEVENKIDATTEELKVFKEQTNYTLSTITSNINSIGNISSNNSTNIIFGENKNTSEELKKISKPNNASINDDQQKLIDQITKEVIFEEDDIRISLARIRMKIEEILMDTCSLLGLERSEYKSFRAMTEYIFSYIKDSTTIEIDKENWLKSTIEEVWYLSNAAIHGKTIKSSEKVVYFIRESIEVISKLKEIQNKIRDNIISESA